MIPSSAEMLLATGGVTDPDARALIGRMSPRPRFRRAKAIEKLIKDLKAANAWSELSDLYVPAAHSQQAAALKWRRDANNLTFSPGIQFAADQGFAGTATSYAMCQLVKSNANPLYFGISALCGRVNNDTGSRTIYYYFGSDAVDVAIREVQTIAGSTRIIQEGRVGGPPDFGTDDIPNAATTTVDRFALLGALASAAGASTWNAFQFYEAIYKDQQRSNSPRGAATGTVILGSYRQTDGTMHAPTTISRVRAYFASYNGTMTQAKGNAIRSAIRGYLSAIGVLV